MTASAEDSRGPLAGRRERLRAALQHTGLSIVAAALLLALLAGADAAGLAPVLFGVGVGAEVDNFDASAVRANLYPAFLALLPGDGVLAARLVQTVLYASSALLLAGQVWRRTPRQTWARLVVALACLGAFLNPRGLEDPFSVAEEGLFLALLFYALAALLAFTTRPAAVLAGAAGLATGLLIGVRPAGWVLVVVGLLALALAAVERPASKTRFRISRSVRLSCSPTRPRATAFSRIAAGSIPRPSSPTSITT